MSKELPWFKFYPSEWFMGRINSEPPAEQVAFLRTCSLYWRRQCMLNKSDLTWYVTDKLLEKLCDKKYVSMGENGEIGIKFLDEQYTELAGLSEVRRRAGQKGGLKTQSKNRAKLKHKDEEVDTSLSIEERKKLFIKKANNNPIPSERLSKDIASKLFDAKVERGEIV